MDFDEFAAMSRELGNWHPWTAPNIKSFISVRRAFEDEEHVDPNTHMKRQGHGRVRSRFRGALCAKGSLGTDAALLGCGSLDDQIQLIIVQLELDADAAGASKRRS